MSFFKKMRKRTPATLVLDTGNALNPSPRLNPFLAPLAEMKAKFMIKAMGQMGYAAYLPGSYDFALGEERLSSLLHQAPFTVLQSGKGQRRLEGSKPYLFGDLFGIGMEVGLIGLSVADSPDEKALESTKLALSAFLRKAKERAAGLAMVLYSGPYRFLDGPILKDSPVNTVVLLSYEGAWWPKPKVSGNGRVLTVSIPSKGEFMGGLDLVMVDPGQPFAQRFEWMLAFYKKRTLEGLLKNPGLKNRSLIEERLRKADAEESQMAKKNLYDWKVVPLDWHFQEDPSMRAEVDAFNAQIRNEYARRFASSVKGPKASEKVSSDRECKPCHAEAWSVWASTSHARAFATLLKGKADKNPECVACHSSGWNPELRLVELDQGIARPNVLCGNCHGNTPSHAKDPKAYPMASGADKKACLGCHTADHSPAFAFDAYLEAIRCDKGPKKAHKARPRIQG